MKTKLKINEHGTNNSRRSGTHVAEERLSSSCPQTKPKIDSTIARSVVTVTNAPFPCTFRPATVFREPSDFCWRSVASPFRKKIGTFAPSAVGIRGKILHGETVQNCDGNESRRTVHRNKSLRARSDRCYAQTNVNVAITIERAKIQMRAYVRAHVTIARKTMARRVIMQMLTKRPLLQKYIRRSAPVGFLFVRLFTNQTNLLLVIFLL